MTTAQAGQPPRRRSGSLLRKLLLLMLAGGGLAVAVLAYAGRLPLTQLKQAIASVEQASERVGASQKAADPPPPDNSPWDGLVRIAHRDQKSMGFTYFTVQAQSDPIRLELNGTTAYDPNTITKVRPRFDTRVEKVHASLGQQIKKGDNLVELYSTDLADAKTAFQTKFVQWQHDRKLYDLRQRLVETGAISQQLWVDTQNDEQKSRLEFNIALDKLSVFYEIPKDEIDPLLEKLGDKTVDLQAFGSVSDKAKMIMRSKIDGIVITREVVPGNYYQDTDVLMEIAPLDHLWVWVNVFEVDQDKVRVGQIMEIQFPFINQTISGTVDYVANEVSKDTRAVRVRASIPNPAAKLRSGLLVKAQLQIPPVAGHTIVPRIAMVTISGDEFVFVRKTGEKAGPEGTDSFERRKIEVAQENTDTVVVARGLKAGEEVITIGSLIISQLYEDQKMTAVGTAER